MKKLLSVIKALNTCDSVADCACTIAGIEFLKFSEEGDRAILIAKEPLFKSRFGDNNNFTASDSLSRLKGEILPKIIAEVGEENVLDFETDLLSLDGSDKHGKLISKISIPTFDFYRANVKAFDKYKPSVWWWLATPEGTTEHSNDNWSLCVSPHGDIFGNYYCDYGNGVRPVLHFISSISVSCED